MSKCLVLNQEALDDLVKTHLFLFFWRGLGMVLVSLEFVMGQQVCKSLGYVNILSWG